jgi:hypothetical protein
MNPALLALSYVLPALLVSVLAVVLRRHLGALLSGRRGADLADLRARLADLRAVTPRTPPLLRGAPTHPLSLLVEARVLGGCPSQARSESEQEVLQNPGDPGAFVALSKALLYCDQEDEARAALRWAQRLGADDAEADYLQARLLPPGPEALHLCLRACRREPAYGEALYLCAQLARGLGLRSEGERLLRHIEPLMQVSLERQPYLRELGRLPSERPGPARRLLGRLAPRPDGGGDAAAPL